MTAQTLPTAFAPPSLAQILDDIAGDIETSIDGADARLPRQHVWQHYCRIHSWL